MNFLDIAAVQLLAGSANQDYPVPLRGILLSDEMYVAAVRRRTKRNAHRAYQARICGDEAVEALPSAWNAVSRCTGQAGQELVLLGPGEKDATGQLSIKSNGGLDDVCSQCA